MLPMYSKAHVKVAAARAPSRPRFGEQRGAVRHNHTLGVNAEEKSDASDLRVRNTCPGWGPSSLKSSSDHASPDFLPSFSDSSRAASPDSESAVRFRVGALGSEQWGSDLKILNIHSPQFDGEH
jgi:hypothetical protein